MLHAYTGKNTPVFWHAKCSIMHFFMKMPGLSRAEMAVAIKQGQYLSLLVQAWSSKVNDDLKHTKWANKAPALMCDTA